MQVMNNNQFEQTEVLVGQVEETQGFGVSTDASLMSILSTGLYKNPLRSMIQEVMFNAWDAHKMVGKTDVPIDIYLNDTSGLIIRDYGPGIPHQFMHERYCIYGNSTKRGDGNQTGGFGLGCKAPFAYTESFTVTSYSEERQNMYVISRVSDDNEGKPGMTRVLKDIPTQENGLLVTVPIKSEQDLVEAWQHIQDLIPYSGIKLNLHFTRDGEETTETHEMEEVADRKWINSTNIHRGMTAIYGGVKYQIEHRKEYAKAYDYLNALSSNIGHFYIGFPPHSLTPLPSREGLNFSEKTISTITEQLEMMVDTFQEILIPATKAVMEVCLDALCNQGIQDQFLLFRWQKAGNTGSRHNSNLSSIVHLTLPEFEKLVAAHRLNTVAESMWTAMTNFAYRSSPKMASLIGEKRWCQMRTIKFLKRLPHLKAHREYLMQNSDTESWHSTGSYLSKNWLPGQLKDLISARNQAEELIGSSIDIRMNIGSDSSWEVVDNIRGGGGGKNQSKKRLDSRQKDIIKALTFEKKLKVPTVRYTDTLWRKQKGEKVDTLLLEKHIVMAKTATALNETPIHNYNLEVHFTPKWDGETQIYHNHAYQREKFRWSEKVEMVPAIIVHQKKGQYETVKKFLKDSGWTVLEAKEPVKKVKTKELDLGDVDVTPVKRGPPTFPIFKMGCSEWINYDAEEVENPQTYFCCTVSQINGYSSYNKPTYELLNVIQHRWDKIAVLHNKARAGILDRKGVPVLQAKIDKEVDRLLKNKDRIRKMVFFDYAREKSNLPQEVLAIPEMSKIMQIPYIRTRELENFKKDLAFLRVIMNEWRNDHVYTSTSNKVKDAFQLSGVDADHLSLVRQMCAASKMLSSAGLSSAVDGMKKGEQKMLAQKIARFLRTV